MPIRARRCGQAAGRGWDAIPGARLHAASCGFAIISPNSQGRRRSPVGLSPMIRLSARGVERLHLPFAILSDAELKPARALKLPTFEVVGMTLIKRLTLVIDEGTITHAIYPVFPPDKSAADTLAWLSSHPRPWTDAPA